MKSKVLRNIVLSAATLFGATAVTNCSTGRHYHHHGYHHSHSNRTCTTVTHGGHTHTNCRSYSHQSYARHHFNYKVFKRNLHIPRRSCSMAFNNGHNYVMRTNGYGTPTKFCIDGRQFKSCYETSYGSGVFNCYR